MESSKNNFLSGTKINFSSGLFELYGSRSFSKLFFLLFFFFRSADIHHCKCCRYQWWVGFSMLDEMKALQFAWNFILSSPSSPASFAILHSALHYDLNHLFIALLIFFCVCFCSFHKFIYMLIGIAGSREPEMQKKKQWFELQACKNSVIPTHSNPSPPSHWCTAHFQNIFGMRCWKIFEGFFISIKKHQNYFCFADTELNGTSEWDITSTGPTITNYFCFFTSTIFSIHKH